MLVFAGVQKILFQITRERLMCTLKTRIYLWPCSAGTWQGARKSSSSTRSMSRRSLRRRMESCSARGESWTGRGSSPRQGWMKTTWAARCSWTWGPLAVEQAEVRRQGRARGGLRPILRWEYCTTGDALCFKVMVVGPKCQAQTRLQFNFTKLKLIFIWEAAKVGLLFTTNPPLGSEDATWSDIDFDNLI